jgi:hypothetical protein
MAEPEVVGKIGDKVITRETDEYGNVTTRLDGKFWQWAPKHQVELMDQLSKEINRKVMWWGITDEL